MRESKYNVMIDVSDIDTEKSILYNTLSRRYVVVDKEEGTYVESLLHNLNKSSFDIKEIETIKKLILVGAIIQDEVDEINKLNFLYNQYKFSDDKFSMVIVTTLDCNFRCTYCTQDHRSDTLDDEVSQRIIKLVKEKCRKAKRIRVAWFGGEPMLEFDRIVKLTREFKKICHENGCTYEAGMTTNGYLFNDDNIAKLNELHINEIQITLDGTESYHDQKRVLSNGQGTFAKIRDNCEKLLRENIGITLRVNVDESNYPNIIELFDVMPQEYRRNIRLQILNIRQNTKFLDSYDLYKSSIERGYPFCDTVNTLLKCEAGTPSSITVFPKGELSFCSMAGEKGHIYGYLDENGDLKLRNPAMYHNIYNTSPFSDKACAECKSLPACMGQCVFSKYKTPHICLNKGLTIEQKAKLHYYSDKKLNRKVAPTAV